MNLVHPALSGGDLLGLFAHFTLLSLLSVGGAIATAPDMHRYLVVQQHWITDTQFSASIAIAQAAPGPNLLFVAVLGWNVAGALGAFATMAGILLPSTLISLGVARYSARRQQSFGLRAFSAGLAPLTLGLLSATGWLLAEPALHEPTRRLGALGLLAFTLWGATRARIGPIWLVATGALVGGLGWV